MRRNYLDVIYFRDEYGENKYPQKLCNYISDRFFGPAEERKEKKILDIGSGKGNHLVGFKRNGLEVYGIDKRKECLEALVDFDIRDCNLEKEPLPFEDNTFDFVFSKSVLEHVVNTDNFLKEALRVLKPGGVAVILTPDWRSQCLFFWDDYTHVKAFTRKSLQNAMDICGFESPECEYFLQLPLVWKFPWLKVFTVVIALLPDYLKWKDKRESEYRTLIRFSKEKMLLSYGKKHR
jgi:SAM-dependent methyltransferase